MRITSSNAGEIRAAVREYCTYARGDVQALARKQMLSLVIGAKGVKGLLQETQAIAPSPNQIAAKVRSLGWRVIKRGTPGQWIGQAARQVRGKEKTALKASKPTLEQMQAYVIKKRVDAIFYLASGWLGAASDLGGSASGSARGALGHRSGVQRKRGGANIGFNGDVLRFEIWNNTPGIETMDQKKGFVARAVANRLADLRVYIERKKSERAAALKGR